MATLNLQSPSAQNLLPGQRSNGNPNSPAGLLGEMGVSEFLPRYHALAKSGLAFSLSSLAVNPAAFVGAAAGTPLFGLYNPNNSGKDLVIIQARLAIRTTGTVAVNASTAFFAANQGGVAVTGTQTQARNMYSQGTTGSVAYGMVNVVNTGAVASNLIAPSASVQATATAANLFTQLLDPVDGAIIVPPGGYLAYGLTAALTGGSMDASLIWVELPV